MTPDEVDDREIARWAEQSRMAAASSGPDVVLGWGDMEVQWQLVRSADAIVFRVISRGSGWDAAAFEHLSDAKRFLLMKLATSAFSASNRPWPVPELRADVVVNRTSHPTPVTVATWPGGWAHFVHDVDARRFSHLIDVPILQLSAAWQARRESERASRPKTRGP